MFGIEAGLVDAHRPRCACGARIREQYENTRPGTWSLARFYRNRSARRHEPRVALATTCTGWKRGESLSLGGFELPFDRGGGHAGRAMCWRIGCDALLGAAGLGIPATHFQDSDRRGRAPIACCSWNMPRAPGRIRSLRSNTWEAGGDSGEPKRATIFTKMRVALENRSAYP